MWVESCSADSAPGLSSIRTAAVRDTPWSPSGSMGDTWAVGAEEVVREHRKLRRELFTPLRVAGAPPAKSFTPARITEGRFVDIGEVSKRVDTWTARGSAHEDVGRRWTGRRGSCCRPGQARSCWRQVHGVFPRVWTAQDRGFEASRARIKQAEEGRAHRRGGEHLGRGA